MRKVLIAAVLAAVAFAAEAEPFKPPAPKSKLPATISPKLVDAVVAAPPPKTAPPTEADWRTPDPNDVLVIDTNKGRILVELVPEAAPQHVQRMRELTHEGFFDGLRFFRVVEKFMDQTGDPQNSGQGGSSKPNVPAEFMFRRGADTPFAMAADQTVVEVGYVKSLPVMSQSMALAPMTKDQKVSAWGLFCQGVAGMARDSNEDSANSQFFLMRGPYPSLEKRYTAFGRVISGMDVVTAIKVGEPVPDPQDRMEHVHLLADMPVASRPKVRVIDPKSPWFKAEVARIRAFKGADFSACNVDMPVEVK
jgi:peptidylprolyl isomerase